MERFARCFLQADLPDTERGSDEIRCTCILIDFSWKHIILLLGCLGCLFAGCPEPSYRLTVSIYGNGSLPGDTVYLYRFNEETLQFEKGDSAMLDDRQQVCFTGKYTGPEFVCGE